ncbi:ABC transporter permease [Pontibacterium sp.]|uniref:ABC transporter permease n=1 Tax=Pontibacterium sp. TaxID=2036026 RepID=UPI00356522AF
MTRETFHHHTTDLPSSQLALRMLLQLAWRNLWRHRKRTLITLSSIAIGFSLAVISIGLGDGSHNSMVRNAIQLGEGHLTVQPPGYLASPANHKFIPDGQTLAQQMQQLEIAGHIDPRISLQILASTAHNSVGSSLQGMDTQHDQRIRLLKPKLIAGHWLEPDDQRGILIGVGMSRKLKAKVGSKVVLMAGKQSGDSQAQLGRVRGIFASGVAELDDFLVLSEINFARYFLLGESDSDVADTPTTPVTRVAVFLDNPDRLNHWKARLSTALKSEQIAVLDWQEMMPQLVQFIIVDDAGNYIFLTLILIMVGFGIINTVLMSVLERTREFGLLRALGLSRSHLLLLVFAESLLLSVLAVTAGWLIGGSAHLWFASQGIDLSGVMSESTEIMGTFIDPVVYTELSWARIIQLTTIIFITTLSSGIYPAIKAARVTPVEALRT